MYKTLLISLLPALFWTSCSLVESEDTPADSQKISLDQALSEIWIWDDAETSYHLNGKQFTLYRDLSRCEEGGVYVPRIDSIQGTWNPGQIVIDGLSLQGGPQVEGGTWFSTYGDTLGLAQGKMFDIRRNICPAEQWLSQAADGDLNFEGSNLTVNPQGAQTVGCGTLKINIKDPKGNFQPSTIQLSIQAQGKILDSFTETITIGNQSCTYSQNMLEDMTLSQAKCTQAWDNYQKALQQDPNASADEELYFYNTRQQRVTFQSCMQKIAQTISY